MSFYSFYSMFLLVTEQNCYFSHLHAGAGSDNIDSRVQTVGLCPSFPHCVCPGASRGTHGDAKCVTEILRWEIK